MNRQQRRAGVVPPPHQDHPIGKDVGLFMLPNLNERMSLLTANRASLGFVEGDEREPSGEMNGDDIAAVIAAAIGLCYRSGVAALDDLPSFRSFKRDIVAYGEEVQTRLFVAGYRDAEALSKVGDTLIGWVAKETFGEALAVEEEKAVFPSAPT